MLKTIRTSILFTLMLLLMIPVSASQQPDKSSNPPQPTVTPVLEAAATVIAAEAQKSLFKGLWKALPSWQTVKTAAQKVFSTVTTGLSNYVTPVLSATVASAAPAAKATWSLVQHHPTISLATLAAATIYAGYKIWQKYKNKSKTKKLAITAGPIIEEVKGPEASSGTPEKAAQIRPTDATQAQHAQARHDTTKTAQARAAAKQHEQVNAPDDMHNYELLMNAKKVAENEIAELSNIKDAGTTYARINNPDNDIDAHEKSEIYKNYLKAWGNFHYKFNTCVLPQALEELQDNFHVLSKQLHNLMKRPENFLDPAVHLDELFAGLVNLKTQLEKVIEQATPKTGGSSEAPQK